MNGGYERLGWVRRLEFTAAAAIAIAVACVMIGQGAERYAASEPPPVVAVSDPGDGAPKAVAHNAPIFNTIDYATTGSIKGQTVVISPCTGEETQR
jgi:hypothetical protein